MTLNSEQNRAILCENQFIFLLAGAGSGKTRVIVERIKHLIGKGIDASKILCITFTNRACGEMEERLKGYQVAIHTFHGYCYQILHAKREFQVFEYNQAFTENEILAVANYKNSLATISKPKVFDKYQKYLQKRDLLDFDDLMIEALDLVCEHTYEYIFIDEFQDTNLLQFKLLSKMIKNETNVFAVGDPDQSIYAFRGAKMDLVNAFVNRYHAKVLKLEMNYRSNTAILNAANNLIKHNKNRFKKTLISQKEGQRRPCIYIGGDLSIEKTIVDMIRKEKLFEAVILFRNHYQVVRIKQILERNYLFGVKLLSFHEAKGLEFDTVMIVGCEILPFDKDHTFSNGEEERRLLFVGITRAINNLYLFSTKITPFLRQTKLLIIKIDEEENIGKILPDFR